MNATHCKLITAQFTMQNSQSTLHTSHGTLQNAHCTLHISLFYFAPYNTAVVEATTGAVTGNIKRQGYHVYTEILLRKTRVMGEMKLCPPKTSQYCKLQYNIAQNSKVYPVQTSSTDYIKVQHATGQNITRSLH